MVLSQMLSSKPKMEGNTLILWSRSFRRIYFRARCVHSHRTRSALACADALAALSRSGTTWRSALKRIQGCIDVASRGNAVVVGIATWCETIHFEGENVVLCRWNLPGQMRVLDNIIRCNASGAVLALTGTGDDACVLVGFTTIQVEMDPRRLEKA